jgi:hypothetical protein
MTKLAPATPAAADTAAEVATVAVTGTGTEKGTEAVTQTGAEAVTVTGAQTSADTAAEPVNENVPSPRDAIGGWLSGPQIESRQDEWSHRGERLGLPESGPGALAGQGRRLGALCVDWAIAYLATGAFGWHPGTAQGQWGVIALFAAQMLLLESLLGYTIGKRIFGIQVGRLGGPLTPVQVSVRTVLLLLVIPAVIWDRDGRGMHDRLAGTVVVNR